MENIIGEKFIQFLSERNYKKLIELFHNDVTARLLIPGGLLTVYTSENLMKKMNEWFCESDIFELMESDITALGGKIGIRYKFRGRENGAHYLVEQQTFSKILDGKINSFDLLCSGFQNIDS